MSPRFRRLLATLSVILLGLVLPVLAQEEPPEPITTADPAIPVEHLALRLDPLTQEELVVEADAWRDLVKAKATEIAEMEIESRDPENPERDALIEQLATLREAKDAQLERLGVVLEALEVKGGDVEAYKQYSSAVAGIKTDPTDVKANVSAFSAWLTSKEGGVKWGIRLLQFVGIMVVSWIVAALVGRIVGAAIERSEGLSGLLKRFIKKTVRRVVLFVGFLVALGTLDVNVGAALALIGGGAFILGFALQDTLSNLANGIMLMINRPFDVGDAVEVGGVLGKVDSVDLVSTTILTFDNRKVIVPNKNVWGQTITNITTLGTRRVDMMFGIGYDDDMDAAQAIIERVVSEHPLVLKEPEPNIRLKELADSSVNFICWPWCKTSDYLTVLSEITKRVKEEFDKAGISIPFPQRDVHVYQAAQASADDPEATGSVQRPATPAETPKQPVGPDEDDSPDGADDPSAKQ